MNTDRHYTGAFNIMDEQISGEIIHNDEKGIIVLNLIKEVGEFGKPSCFGKSYGDIPVIVGKLNTGATVTLYKNRCIKNNTNVGSNQQIQFISNYMIWSKNESVDKKYNKMSCRVKNALEWSSLPVFEESNQGLKVKEILDKKEVHWFGAKISFSPYVNHALYIPPTEEETKIEQRLVIEIELNKKSDVDEFVQIRNKVLSLISFAIKNNVNIEHQYLEDYDDFYTTSKINIPYKYYLYSSESMLDTLKIFRWDYNFMLNDLGDDSDISEKLEKLEPIFSLYLSLVKYSDMPVEMVFLNIVQALETFHSRFFYENKKDKYLDSVKSRFGGDECYNKLLLSDTQIDKNCHFIILVSRLNDLFIGENDGLFYDYYISNNKYAQTIADTRHYYTHYGKEKEAKALKGDELLDAIYILRLLLEYHVCLILGINKRDQIQRSLNNHIRKKELSKV